MAPEKDHIPHVEIPHAPGIEPHPADPSKHEWDKGMIIVHNSNSCLNFSRAPMYPETILPVLIDLAAGTITPEEAASLLDLDLTGLEALVADHPELAEEAARIAQERLNDPDHTLTISQQGLHHAASALARRIQENPDALTVGEMVAAGGLLEKISGASEKRKAEIKAETVDPVSKEKAAQRLPLVIVDDRPNPVTGYPRLLTMLIPPDSPAWVDTSDPQFQSPQYDWLQHHLPLSPVSGEPLDLELLTTRADFRYMDAEGRVYGGHL